FANVYTNFFHCFNYQRINLGCMPSSSTYCFIDIRCIYPKKCLSHLTAGSIFNAYKKYGLFGLALEEIHIYRKFDYFLMAFITRLVIVLLPSFPSISKYDFSSNIPMSENPASLILSR